MRLNTIYKAIMATTLCATLCSCTPVADSEDAVPGGEIAKSITKHCVKVKIYTKKDEGEPPSYRFAEDLENERPTLIGGYMWNKDTVIINDPVIHDRFIRKIEIEFGDTTVPATIKGRFLRHQSILLTLQKPLEGPEPIKFSPTPERKEWGKLRAVDYSYSERQWKVYVHGAINGLVRNEDNSILMTSMDGLLVDPQGKIVGIAFGDKMSLESDAYPWQGEKLREEKLLTTAEKKAKHEELKKNLDKAMLEVKLNFRNEIEEDDSWDRQETTSVTEMYATGLLYKPNRLFVPIDMKRALVARLKSISVYVQNGIQKKEYKAQFIGMLKDLKAMVIELEENQVTGSIDIENPGQFDLGELFLKANINYNLKKRKEKFTYDRFNGFMRDYMDIPGVTTFTNETNGSIAFTTTGKPLAIAVAVRKKPTGEQYDHYGYNGDDCFRPLSFIAKELRNGKAAIDPTFKILKKEQEKRIVTLGVEFQRLSLDLAKDFKVEKETRGGSIGLLLVYVYPGSQAEKMGLKEEDILLRVKSEDRSEPIELGDSNGGYYEGGYYEGYGRHYGGSGWPENTNIFTRLLTKIGEGKKVKLTYLHKGREKSVDFVTRKGPPDFNAAPKYKSKKLGMTVKAVTYEIKRFLKRKDDNDVIISKVEPGSPASVANIHARLLITHIDGVRLKGLEDFKQRIKAIESGVKKEIEFTVELMGKTAPVKIELK